MTAPLSSWREGATRDAILPYVEEACIEGSAGWIPAADRVAVFDNDGTLWREKPMPMHDRRWLATVMADHDAGGAEAG
jgi:hypothetical protein